ncbi:hypothetical protein F0U44_11165 [Nocardioides humilatus]|uniref:DUF7948 domain-containing protein n=1 Tax=Nocardioides humilatus TaxID=2607660 RepID=A0A5B1LED4_9ACTN|nr:SBBP repeat-containing protein [Nocardioides humilatus]KAA1419015.1 hypothetical protein F0U44_11165 [Nocardioides humilatus]
MNDDAGRWMRASWSVHSISRQLAALVPLALTATLTAFTAQPAAQATPPPASADASKATEHQARHALADLPLSFEANRGQSDARVRYLARGDGFTLFLTRHRAVFGLDGAAVALKPVGAARNPRLVGRSPQQATTSYFRGKDPSRWRRGVPAFGRVRYQGLYRGIDMVVRGNRSGAEYDFVVAAGADPSRIGYRLQGADRLRIRHGDLVASTAAGRFIHRAPVAYQRIDGERRRVDARFRLRHGVVSFALGSYDASRRLVIDPETDLEYSTYLGGNDDDDIVSVVVRDGDVYVAGTTYSDDFPTTPGAYPDTPSGSDVFVSRLALDGGGSADLVYSAILGGGAYDTMSDMAVEDGDIYVAGDTESSNFPITAGAFDDDLYGSDGGGTDTFFAKISPDGNGAADLAYSSFLGGNYYNSGRAAIAVHNGDIYLAGSTDGGPYPQTPGAPYHNDYSAEIFLTRISPDGNGEDDLVYGAMLGGAGDEGLSDIAISGGDVYLTGSAYYELTDKKFPATRGAYDRTYNGEYDIYVMRISPDGNKRDDIKYSSLLGTRRSEGSSAIAVRDGKVYLTGSTCSHDFPTTRGAYDRSYNAKCDVIVSVLATNRGVEHDLKYSTFFGAGADDDSGSIRVSDGRVYLVGTTESPGLPTKGIPYDSTHNGKNDGFLAVFALGGRRGKDLKYATFLGGPKQDGAYALALDGGYAYVAGFAGADFPVTPGAFDTTSNSEGDAFVARLLLPGSG